MADEHLGCFPLFALTHRVVINVLVHVSWWTCVRVSSEWNYLIVSYAHSILLGTANLFLQSGYTNFHSVSCVRDFLNLHILANPYYCQIF